MAAAFVMLHPLRARSPGRLLPPACVAALLASAALIASQSSPGEPSPSGARLETVELTSHVFGNSRTLRVLLPAGYDEANDRRYPVLYMLDGQTLFDPAGLVYAGGVGGGRDGPAWPEKIHIAVGTNEEGRPSCDPEDRSSEAVVDVLRLESILRGMELGPDRLRVRIHPCAEHNELWWGRRFPEALTFLYGWSPGGDGSPPKQEEP